jgi:hypothetical protein
MKSHTEHLTFNIPARMGFTNITPQCEAALRKSGVQEGLLLANAMHITASVFISEIVLSVRSGQPFASTTTCRPPFVPSRCNTSREYQFNGTSTCVSGGMEMA